MRFSYKLATCSLAIAVSTISTAALAQDAGDAVDDSSGANEIVVTAQKRDERLQDVPIAVTAFTPDQLTQSGISDVLELAAVTPSLLITEGSSAAQPYIRGVGGRNITPGNEATTAVYVDGVYQTDKTGILLQGFPDVQSVQVLRGPQGTLFGRNATSGAILVTTQKPDTEFGAMLEGTYGTDEEGARGFVTGGFSDTLALSVSGFYRNERPYIRNRTQALNGAGKYVGGDKSFGFRGALLWEATPDFTATLAGYYSKGETNAVVALQPILGETTTTGQVASGIDISRPERSYYGQIDPEVRFQGYGGSLTLDADVGPVNIKSISAYSHSTSGVEYDLDGSPANVFWFDTALKGRSYQQEIDITSMNDGPFQWILGGFYLNYRDGYAGLDQYVGLPVPSTLRPHTIPQALLDRSAAGAGPASGLAYIDQSAFVTVKSLGIFGEVSYAFSDAAKLTLGLRYTDEKHTLDKDNAGTTYVPNGTGGVVAIPSNSAAICAANPDCDGLSAPFSELTYRAVFDYKFSDDVLGYLSYNRGFKSGVYNISSIPNVIPTEPETIDAFEVGLKTSLFDRKVTFNAAAYYYKYDNLQVPVVNPVTNTQQSINAAKATISGLEIEASYRPDDRFSLSAGFSTFFKSEYDEFKNCVIYRRRASGLAIPPNADCSGFDLPATPDVTVSLQANYDIPLANGGTFELSGLFSYVDSFDHATYGYYPAGGTGAGAYPEGIGRAPVQKATETLNLSATFRAPDDRFYVSVWGKDLFNQNDIFRNVSTTSFGYYSVLSRGITGGVTIGTKFGSQR
jgi:iron complex outermembrane receptor protein